MHIMWDGMGNGCWTPLKVNIVVYRIPDFMASLFHNQ